MTDVLDAHPSLPGIPAPRPRAPHDEVRRVMQWRDALVGLDPLALEVEPFEHGTVVMPVELFVRLVEARLTVEEIVR